LTFFVEVRPGFPIELFVWLLTWFSNQTIGLTTEMYVSLVGDVESYLLPLVTITAPSGVAFPPS
jgi:hypothetical protein